jgi:signal transduction histidine kinase
VLALCALSLGAGSVIARLRQAAGSLRAASARLGRALDELRLEQAKQKELADLKSRFVSMASHEFRTPLSVIMSSGELLAAYADRWSVERKAEHYVRIHSAALGMTRMLDSILTIGRSDADALRFEPLPLDIDRFCAELLEAVEVGARPRRIVYGGQTPRGRVMADQALLKHILENLLSNALKYSPAPLPVAFEVNRVEREIVFCVSDQGIGIPVEDQQRLFETFHRGKNVGTVSGAGLGLAIVKRALDLHGGSLSLDSELGRGTRFTVRIPCAEGRA